MPRLVIHPLTLEPVLVSPERGERPGAWGGSRSGVERSCPFCPGHENETPPEISRHGEGQWSARVVPNKYPAIAPVEGIASHEVLIDTPEHESALETRDLSSLVSMVELWRERFMLHASRAAIESVVLFRNEGRAAGQSLEHPHSQLIALPFVAPRLRSEMHGFDVSSSCPLCPLSLDVGNDERVITSGRGLVLLCPPAPRLPYECWIVPERHETDWTECAPAALAETLRIAARTLRRRWPGAAFNLAISSAPFRAPGRKAFHWHLEVLPRLTGLAGFELATGSWINIVDPSRAAQELRAAARSGARDA